MIERAWVATRKGLFELRLSGGHWRIERVRFLAAPVSMLLPSQAGGRMLAALNLGHFGVKVHASDDAGASWHEVAPSAFPEQPKDAASPAWTLVPHRIVRCAARPEVLWCQHHCGIWKSGDNAAHWQELKAHEHTGTSSFGFAVAVHPHDADTAWFVPAVKDERRVPVDAALSVTRTRDGGSRWRPVSVRLPPIDAVRFG